MKLRNKKTGEIRLAVAREDGVYLYNEIIKQWHKYELDLLAEWWEYYEEPKEYWYIEPLDEDIAETEETETDGVDKFNKEIGNYFETREEAKLAVEKLKALTRLKDKGFRFDGWEENHHNLGIIEFSFDKVDNNVWDFEEDLDLLFSGGENNVAYKC